ncbi:MAG: UvrB/UvrC motif-containing protein [Planctomycetes bacterium]|nr:UvrB/UvrC motif-containing protein [Planctomycetota bacterium]
MSSDIDPILRDWPYRPDEITVRVVEGEDGRRKIQLRLDLGMLQMEFDGRPDGRRIHDEESWFAYHQRRQRDHDAANPDGAPYLLEPEDCAELLREGVQYYHRYICFWHLGHYELCARDTERNLRLFAFVRGHARDDRDKLRFDQWRPYVTMMHARAVATPLVELEQWDAAAGVLDAGIRGIERFLEEYDQVEQAPRVGELTFLRRWKEEILSKIEAASGSAVDTVVATPDLVDRAAELRAQIELAVAEERYEDAAMLRDELRRLENDL